MSTIKLLYQETNGKSERKAEQETRQFNYGEKLWIILLGGLQNNPNNLIRLLVIVIKLSFTFWSVSDNRGLSKI